MSLKPKEKLEIIPAYVSICELLTTVNDEKWES